MISTAIIRMLWGVASPVIERIPSISISADSPIVTSALSWVRCALYLFPMGTVLKILTLILALWVMRVVISVLRTLWSALPIL